MFYSPRHLTFIFVYLTPYGDSTFYYRYLIVPSPIIPSYAGGGDSDIVENITKFAWSKEHILYKADPGATGRAVEGGGPHQGYFDSDDIVNGGTKMLLTWSVPTGQDPASTASEYELRSAVVEWE